VLGRGGRRRGREEAEQASRAEQRRAAAEKRIGLQPLKKQVDAAEKSVARLTAEIARIDRELGGGLFARDPGKATALSKARTEATSALAKAEEDWLAASSAYEDAMA